ncbi:MAG: flagellar hook protein FlgE [Spirochaetaceae bacterium]|jgi:flagellar hook protein FlgE|nr:flagellar hook protein FlgE [Spirochaetaceae bacterium]
MMRSLFSGVSGLQNHQTRMDVVGNNISNINTTGFKKGRVNFQDMLYQQLAGAARPTEDVGGVNPKEVGLGMSIASIDTIHTQGSLQSTGVGTDLAITGNGFFILKEGANAYYTRAGAFSADEQGNLVNPSNGWFVQGWMAQEVGGTMVLDVSRDTENIMIPTGGKDPARATTTVNFGCNLDKRMPYIPAEGANELDVANGTWTTSIKIYDSFGEEHTLRAQMTRILDTPNDWNVLLAVDPEADEEPGANALAVAAGLGEGGTAAGGATNFTVTFNNDGTLLSVTDAAGNAIGGPDAAGNLLMPVAFNVITAAAGEDGAPVRQEFEMNLGTIGGFTNSMTQFAEKSSTKAFTQDGYTMGYLENFKIDQSGTITGVYTNGTNRTLGQIALASFSNQGGLEKAGETAFVVSSNSGTANIGPSGIAGKGKIIAGTLEMSNVDMAAEFVDMIVTQRGFQANSRTIQTADQLLQELLQLKR